MLRVVWSHLRAVRSETRALVDAVIQQPLVRQRIGIIAAACLVTAYALGILAYVLRTPEIGIRCAFSPVVNHFFSEYLCPEDQTPLQPGDRVVQVGDRDITTWPQLLRTLNDCRGDFPANAEHVTGAEVLAGKDRQDRAYLLVDNQRVIRVRYQRPGESGLRTAWCRLGQPLAETLVPSTLWFFLKIGLFVVGAIVFWKRPEDRSAAQFFRLCIVSLGAYLGGYHWARIVTQPVLLVIFIGCAMMLPPVSLHFYLLFPRPKSLLERQPRWTLLAIYGPPVAFLLLLLSGYARVRWLAAAPTEVNSEAMRLLLSEMLVEIYCYFGIAALLHLASIVCLVHSFRSTVDATERNQVKWILFGALGAVVPIGYSLYLAFVQPEQFGGGAATWPMFAASVCVTAAFTVSITRYRLMQLDQLVSSGAVYFLLSFVAGLVYYGLVFTGMLLVGSRGGDWPSLSHAVAVSTTALVLLVALDLARSRFKSVLDRHFRREKYQLDHTLLRMRQALDQLVDPPTLARRLLHTAADLLAVPRGAVYLRQGSPPLYHLSDALGPAPALAELSSGCPLVGALQAHGSLTVLPRTALDPAPRQLLFLGGQVAFALLHEGQLLGLLTLGPRAAGNYGPEDQALLTAFARLTALALVSAEGARTIETLNRDLQAKVEKIAEQQRRILALQSQLTKTTPPSTPLPALALGPSTTEPGGLVGSSPQTRELLALVKKVAASPSAVLLRGESGTGKEVLARLLHEHSHRATQPFVKVHCAALAPGLLESELFGHVKGAFTNAIRDKVGRFEAAHGGTLFLDEIGDITLEVQTRLLRVLQEKTFERVGSSEPMRADVRILAATHQNLEDLIRQGRFREDLFYRLNVFPITLPPLRDRAEDVPELAMHFLSRAAERADKVLAGIEDDALAALKAYHWPGNIRQLENIIERAVVLAETSVVTLRELPPEVAALADLSPPDAPNEEMAVLSWNRAAATGTDGNLLPLPAVAAVVQAEEAERERREREQLVRVLAAAGGNKAEAARALGVARSTLISRLKRLGLN